jgi:hypothetical protein
MEENRTVFNDSMRVVFNNSMRELIEAGDGDVTAAAIIILGDRVVGALDGILSALRAIEERLGNLHDERMP